MGHDWDTIKDANLGGQDERAVAVTMEIALEIMKPT